MKFFGYYLSDHDIFTVSRCPPLGSDVCNTVSLYGSKIIRLKKGHANEIFNPHLSCTDQWKYFRFCDFSEILKIFWISLQYDTVQSHSPCGIIQRRVNLPAVSYSLDFSGSYTVKRDIPTRFLTSIFYIIQSCLGHWPMD